MKGKHIAIGVIVLLVLVQAAYSFTRGRKPATRTAGKAESGETAATVRSRLPAPGFTPDRIVEIVLERPGGGEPTALRRTSAGWTIATLQGAPAREEKVAAFLDILLSGDRVPTAADPAAAGLDGDAGVVVRVKTAGGETAAVRIGPEAPGDRAAAFARDEDGKSAYIVVGDIRGEMGLWRKAAAAAPDPRNWLETRVLSFDPDAATALRAQYPDHRIEGKRAPGTRAWTLAGTPPGGEWSADGFADWLAVLSDFRVTDIADPDEETAAALRTPTHRLEVTLENGDVRSVAASPNRGGDGMWVETSRHPGLVFLLPMWRFKLYFQRMDTLLPNAVPSYAVEDIFTIDLARGGERVKLLRRDGIWRSATPTHPLRQDRIERLVRLLASWRPEDYADADGAAARPAYGGPTVEVLLNGGEVHQYRLGGRHPVFPWRYVGVDGEALFSAPDPVAALLFPDFADIMDLGPVFPGLEAGLVEAMDFTAVHPDLTGDGEAPAAYSLRRNAEDAWEIAMDGKAVAVDPDLAARLIGEPLAWQVSGVYEQEPRRPYPRPIGRIRFESRDGAEHAVTILTPQARDIPYSDGGDRVFLIDRASFLVWMATAAEVVRTARTVPEKPEADNDGVGEAIAVPPPPAGESDAGTAPDEQTGEALPVGEIAAERETTEPAASGASAPQEEETPDAAEIGVKAAEPPPAPPETPESPADGDGEATREADERTIAEAAKEAVEAEEAEAAPEDIAEDGDPERTAE